MEIALAPNGDIYIAEREGRILCYHAKTGATHTIASLQVTALRVVEKHSEWAREDGVLGITLDPAFSSNKKLYIYYSHPTEMLNRLSRFTLANDGSLDLKSEQKLLDVATDRRNRVCHHGGSLRSIHLCQRLPCLLSIKILNFIVGHRIVAKLSLHE